MNFSVLQESLTNALLDMWKNLAAFIPNLIIAVILLTIGFFISNAISKFCRKIFEKIGVNQLADKINLTQSLRAAGVKSEFSAIIAKVIFYILMLMFLIITADTLRLDKVSSTISSFLSFLPDICGAVLILFLCQMAGMFVREALEATSEHLNFNYGKTLGKILYGLILVIGVVLAFGQLKIETTLISNIIQIVLVAGCICIAISIGLGSKLVSQKIITGIYVKEGFSEGDKITIGDVSGTIVSFSPVSVQIKTLQEEIIHIPNTKIMDSIVTCKK